MYKEFYGYLIYNDGKVYSTHTKKFLKGDNVAGYLQYTLSIEGREKKYKAHRLVAMMFIPNPHDYPVVNHIDGNKLNNNVENLEWCTYYHNNKHARDTGLNNVSESNSKRWEDEEFARRTSAKISKTLKERGCNKGRNNPKFRYIILQNGRELSRQELASICGRSISWIDQSIRNCAKGEYIEDFLINNIEIIDTKKGQQTIETVSQNVLCESNGVE